MQLLFCLDVCTCLCPFTCTCVILTMRWVSEGHWKHRQQCQKSGSYSSHWRERVGECVCVWDYSNTQQWGSFLCECPRTVWKNDYAKVHQQRSWHGDKSKKEGTEYVSKWGQARKWKQWHVKCSSCQSVLTVVRYIIKHCCWGEVNTVSRRVNNLVTLHVFSIFGHLHDNNFSSINLYICMTVYIVY